MLKSNRLWLINCLFKLFPETRLFGLKATIMRWCGARIGRNVRISSSARFLGNGELVIGDGVWIGADALLIAVSPAKIEIKEHCDLGPQVAILTGTHRIECSNSRAAGVGIARSVVVGSGCWLCARSLILPGVTIGDRTVVAAGSVVASSFELKNVLLAGVPAKVKKSYA